MSNQAEFINQMNKITEKYTTPRLLNFILSKRYCHKCAQEEFKKGDRVVQLLSTCIKCGKAGICYYNDNLKEGEEEKHYSTPEVAKILGYNHDSYIRRLILERKLGAKKLGNRWIVSQSDIERFKANRKPTDPLLPQNPF